MFMTMEAKSRISAVHAVQLNPGLAMVDTGCRRAVGGTRWHQELQRELDKYGLPYKWIIQKECFQFGPGNPYLWPCLKSKQMFRVSSDHMSWRNGRRRQTSQTGRSRCKA